ncbi:MAG: D-aminoacyl-tRNA deacylase [Gammaproteobacteria bacterium]|jgi:D-aminoacyl-tRNA deacylase|nr:D-aminoacyl-tRNA deacylase [Gammaproteobacteria bacterium]
MLALIQRVTSASVEIGSETVGEIGKGLLVLLGIEKEDERADADTLLNKILAYRVFPDTEGKMNLSVNDIQGGLLIISQFTLAADTNRGLRPSFSTAKAPREAKELYHYFMHQLQSQYDHVASGKFGADMQVSLVNDGPVTFLLNS